MTNDCQSESEPVSIATSSKPTDDMFSLACYEVRHLLHDRIEAHAHDQRPNKKLSDHGLFYEDFPLIYSSLLSFALWQCELMNVGDSESRIDRTLNVIDYCFRCLVSNFCNVHVVEISFNPNLPVSDALMNLMALLFNYSRPSWPLYKSSDSITLPLSSFFPHPLSIIRLPGFNKLIKLMKVEWMYFVTEVLLYKASSVNELCVTSIDHLDGLMIVVDRILPVYGAEEVTKSSTSNAQNILYQFLTCLPHIIIGGPIDGDNVNSSYKLLVDFRDRLALAIGGKDLQPLYKSLLTGLAFEAMILLRKINRIKSTTEIDTRSHVRVEQTVDLIRDIVKTLVTLKYFGRAIQICLESALALDKIEIDTRPTLVLELMNKALNLIDRLITPQEQRCIFYQILSTLGLLRHLDRVALSSLRQRSLRAADRYLDRIDQCRLLLIPSIYWPDHSWSRRCDPLYSTLTLTDQSGDVDHQQRLECQLPECETITDTTLAKLRDKEGALSAIDRSAALVRECTNIIDQLQFMVENLDAAVVLRIKGCSTITDQLLSEKIAKIESWIHLLPYSTASADRVKRHYSNLLKFLQQVKRNDQLFTTLDIVIDQRVY